MKTKFIRAIIFCNDVLALSAFYRDNFGMKLKGKADKSWTVLKAGAVEIAFHQSGSQYLKDDAKKFKGANSNIKLVLQIEDDLEDVRKHLLAKKVKLKKIVRFEGWPYSWCDGIDPEGNVFQLVQPVAIQ